MKKLICALVVLAWAPIAALAAAAPAKINPKEVVKIAFEADGAGDTALIFIHDWSLDRSYWTPQLDELRKSYRVVSVDLGGHGESGKGRTKWTMANFGNDVVTVADHLKLNRIILVGHAMGADVAIEAARRMRERVIGIVWVDAHKTLATPPTKAEIESLVAKYQENFADAARTRVLAGFRPDADSKLVDKVAADVADAPEDIALNSLKTVYNFERDIPAYLTDLGLPVVAINADDLPTDKGSLEGHGIKTVVMAHTGHFLMMEDPARFNKLLKSEVDVLALGTAGPQAAQVR